LGLSESCEEGLYRRFFGLFDVLSKAFDEIRRFHSKFMSDVSHDEFALSATLMASHVFREESEEEFAKYQSVFISGLMQHFALEEAIFPVLQETDESKAPIIQELVREHEDLLNQISDLEHQPKNEQSDKLLKDFVIALLSHARKEDEHILTINFTDSQLERIDKLAKPFTDDPSKKDDTNLAK